MLNKIWPLFIIVAFAFAIYTGNISNVNTAIFSSAEQTVSLCITLLGTMCLWNGIMNIAIKTSLISKLTKFMKPFINFLFPDLKNDKKVSEQVSMNIIANILGLGNASTPLGLKAISSMQEKNTNKKALTNSMAMFILINTASLQIIPTTVIAIRSSLGSTEPSKIILAVWVATIAAFVTAIFFGKILSKKF